RKNDKRISEIFYQKRILKKLLYISFPVSISSLIRSGLRAMENIMIPIGFERYGYTRKLSLEEYGKIQGMVMPVLMFPSSIIFAFSALLIPEVSEANALNQKKRVDYSVTRALQLTAVLSILISGIFVFFSEKLGPAIYDSAECGFLMKVLAPLIPLIYMDIVVDELLKGLNQQVSALKYNIVDAVIKIVMITYVLPIKGLAGLIFVLYICSFINTSLSIRRLLTITQLRLKIKDWVLKPILSIAASGFIVTLLLDAAGKDYFTDGIYILIGAVLAAILYFIFLVKLGCFTKDDFKWFRIIFKYSASRGGIS
ncbi:MAG TPA: polysaccharide biosynthesis C-terminal domain-containing protein, partial [Anaerovoracaceae bacterium]|nr:polysaccharide biosynthesis C-terminal domain-containing protein [Anaerovoracaceae bacterium]